MVCVVTVVVVVLEDIAGAVDWLDRKKDIPDRKKDIPELRMDSLAQDWHSRDWYSRIGIAWCKARIVRSGSGIDWLVLFFAFISTFAALLLSLSPLLPFTWCSLFLSFPCALCVIFHQYHHHRIFSCVDGRNNVFRSNLT